MVLKPSELAPASSSLLENGIPTYLDTKAIRVIEGGPAVGEQIWHQKRDKILFKRMQAYNTFMWPYYNMNTDVDTFQNPFIIWKIFGEEKNERKTREIKKK